MSPDCAANRMLDGAVADVSALCRCCVGRAEPVSSALACRIAATCSTAACSRGFEISGGIRWIERIIHRRARVVRPAATGVRVASARRGTWSRRWTMPQRAVPRCRTVPHGSKHRPTCGERRRYVALADSAAHDRAARAGSPTRAVEPRSVAGLRTAYWKRSSTSTHMVQFRVVARIVPVSMSERIPMV